MADLRRCLVPCAVTGVTFEGGRTFGLGQLVDLDTSIGPDRTVRDDVKLEWFAPVEPEPAVTMRRKPRGVDPDRRLGIVEETD